MHFFFVRMRLFSFDLGFDGYFMLSKIRNLPFQTLNTIFVDKN